MMNKGLLHSSKFDEFYTPCYAVLPLLKYLDKSLIYWECTDFGNSNITRVLKDNGFNVISTNINDFDFLLNEPNFYYDVIITNPPFSKKDLFLKRAYDLKKKFAFLLPLTTLEGVYRGSLFRCNSLELIVLDSRVNFINSKSNWFNTSWFCCGICSKQLNFEKLNVNNDEVVPVYTNFHRYNLFDIMESDSDVKV